MSNSPISILVVDDEKNIRKLLVEYLEDYEEFEVKTANSGEDALEMLAGEKIDVCIVDIRLPGMDGLSFIREAASRELSGHYLIHTGSVDFSLSDDLREFGLSNRDIVFKPGDMDEIIERIREIIGGGS